MIYFHGIEIDVSILDQYRDYKKNPLKKGENPSSNDIEYLYLDRNLTLSELQEFYGRKSVAKYPKLYGLIKTQENIQEAIKRTNLEKYGVEHVLQRKDIRLQIEKTNLEKYGSKQYLSADSAKARIKQTNIEKYGIEYSGGSDQAQAKRKETCLNKYGVDHPAKNKYVQQKIKETNLEKYGYEHYINSCEFKLRSKETCLNKYGVDHTSKVPSIQRKMKESFAQNLGKVLNKYYGNDIWNILSSKENLSCYIKASPNKTVSYLRSTLNVAASTLYQYIHEYNLWDLIDHSSSVYEEELLQLFPFMQKTRKPLFPYEIDLYSEEHKFGIEFNGNYWHSEKNGTVLDYHQKKSLLAEKKGIFLYHIWEYEWNDERKRSIIISQVQNIFGLNEHKIFARKCSAQEVSSKEARTFLNENHLQGYCSSKVNLGLYHENELISLMTFGKPRFDKSCQWELIRYCSKKNTSVIGGASKLFKYFVNEYHPQSILSYSHIDKGTGKLYEKLGFCLHKITKPGYVWCNRDLILPRYQCQKHKLLKQGFLGESEQVIMQSRGFYRLFDCGNKIWFWHA